MLDLYTWNTPNGQKGRIAPRDHRVEQHRLLGHAQSRARRQHLRLGLAAGLLSTLRLQALALGFEVG